MSASHLNRYMLGVIAALGILAGCGAHSQVTPTATAASQATHGKSWMKPGTSAEDLLYVTDKVNSLVYVFSYPGLQKVGTLDGFNLPFGECIDGAGNIWIVNQSPPEAIEYAHAGTKPIATLSVPGDIPYGCAVDPKSGNLAVTYSNNNVAIYPDAQGTPLTYTDSAFYRLKFCSYDNEGNLFVVGSGWDRVAELPQGSSSFIIVEFNKGLQAILSIQWDGKYLAIGGNQPAERAGPEKVYQVQISSGYGTVETTTYLHHARGHGAFAQFWIEGSTIVQSFGDSSRYLGVWNFPEGGSPVTHYQQGSRTYLFGSVISPAYSSATQTKR